MNKLYAYDANHKLVLQINHNNIYDIVLKNKKLSFSFDKYIGRGSNYRVYKIKNIIYKNKIITANFIIKITNCIKIYTSDIVNYNLIATRIKSIKTPYQTVKNNLLKTLKIFWFGEIVMNSEKLYYYIQYYIPKEDVAINFNNFHKYFLQLTKQVEILRNAQIVHADLKYDNLIINKKRINIIDFSNAEFINTINKPLLSSTCVCSPEGFLNIGPYDKADYFGLLEFITYFLIKTYFTYNYTNILLKNEDYYNEIKNKFYELKTKITLPEIYVKNSDWYVDSFITLNILYHLNKQTHKSFTDFHIKLKDFVNKSNIYDNFVIINNICGSIIHLDLFEKMHIKLKNNNFTDKNIDFIINIIVDLSSFIPSERIELSTLIQNKLLKKALPK